VSESESLIVHREFQDPRPNDSWKSVRVFWRNQVAEIASIKRVDSYGPVRGEGHRISWENILIAIVTFVGIWPCHRAAEKNNCGKYQ